ncbi:unnamed protein product, partial [Choristocarpus tenellus]
LEQALPEEKKSLSAELFWLTFRLHAKLPLTPLNMRYWSDAGDGGRRILGDLFNGTDVEGCVMPLHVLCSFAEGSFHRVKTKTNKVGRGRQKDNIPQALSSLVTPTRTMAARRLLSSHVTREAAVLQQDLMGALDATPPLMYYAAAWAWLELLTRGPRHAEDAMMKALVLANKAFWPHGDSSTQGVSRSRESLPGAGIFAGNHKYTWNVVPEESFACVCLERMHRSFCEMLVLAQHYIPADTGPRKVREAVVRGLLSFPAEASMLAMLLHGEKYSGSQQRLVHHLSQARM